MLDDAGSHFVLCCCPLPLPTSFAGGLCTGVTGHNNPQFLVRVKQTTVCFFTLSQSGQTRDSFHGIMGVLFPGSKPRRTPLAASDTSSGSFFHTGAPSPQREVSTTG